MAIANTEVWAIPINTLLLIILAVTNAYLAGKSKREHQDLVDIKRKIGISRRVSDDPHNPHPPDTGDRRRVSDHHNRRAHD